jgi:signal transduction histidine kinase
VGLERSLSRLAYRPHLPRRTVRLRLTVLYGLLFLVSSAVLLVFTNALVRKATAHPGDSVVVSKQGAGKAGGPVPSFNQLQPVLPRGATSITYQQAQTQNQQLKAKLLAQHNHDIHQLLVYSELALAVMVVVSLVLGWIVAGRVLRPLRTITGAAQDISATSLNARLPLDGPDDELKELGRTFNQLLARLEKSFDAQRRFVANASHELRTPLARQRTVAQVALADPDANVETLRAAHERVLASGVEQEHLIDALLTLARGEAGLGRKELIDLSVIADGVLLHRAPEPDRLGLTVETTIMPALLMGDARLVERLVANVVDNACRHNVPGGRVEVSTITRAGRAVLSVSNSGPIVPASEVDRLFQPFQRMAPDRTHHRDGVGLGLSIVRAVAVAHGATVDTKARPEGGLTVTVSFAPVPAGVFPEKTTPSLPSVASSKA